MIYYITGPKRQETKKRPKIGGAELPQLANFEGETLSMLGTIYKNKAQGNFVERNANLIVQICDEKKTKPVGIVKINLGTFIEEQSQPGGTEGSKVQKMMLEKCPDKNAFIEFSLQTTLVSANATGQDNLSQMSEAQSMYDSGPESEFDFQDFLEEEKDDTRSAIAKIRSKINKQPAMIIKSAKAS